MQESRYERRGSSASKREIHAAIADMDRGIHPGAFAKILPDILGGDPRYANVLHADGAGTKSIVAYLWWRETGDASVFRGIAQDAIVMNTDDLLCVGVTDGLLLSSTIARNRRLVTGEVIREIIDGTEAFCRRLRELGLEIRTAGGETEDMGDLVRTVAVNITVAARVARDRIIVADRIEPGDRIVGLASAGRTRYESEPNAGIGSNGFTSARHDLLCRDYADKYPESLDPGLPEELAYAGPLQLTDPVPGLEMPVGRALLSPTRTYAPVICALLEGGRDSMHGIIHLTGGGQTKCLRFGTNIHYIKDDLFPTPPLFDLIERTSGTESREMYEVFNMGHRMEVILPEGEVDRVVRAAAEHGVEARVVGRCEASDGRNRLTIRSERGEFAWSADSRRAP